ncbi:SusE domain-containing protein [Mucilaginibacter lacusdianchii]|uniref:SusE domain-containing protein n=1 Tax=Mucilaginibacter lacusdianchii TaxID=2684211 RepID=UPI00131C7CA2|nr:SusE domain-containing protein [Mucilaginibacter sp. JXJ CY 39]
MKKIIYSIFLLGILFNTACKKNAELTTLQPVSFSGSLQASTSSVALTTANDTSSVVTLSWPAVVYPVKASVTYTLQADVPTDTVGTNAWAGATSIALGKDVLSKSYKGTDLNNMAMAMGLTAGTQGKLVFRVQAYQDRYAYSKAVTVNVTPHKTVVAYPVLYVPGDYQGWSPATAPTIAAVQADKIYDGYINIPSGGTNHFKFTSAPDWNHINYGDGGNGTLTTDGLAGDLVVPEPGYYELSANLNTNTWTYAKTTWSIIGDATPGGWSSDTQLKYDASNKVWTVTADIVSTGSFKFRANNAWVIDFGIDANGKLAYADSPVYGYNAAIGNITVPTSGNYTITLDLHDPTNYNYKLKKN